jgi:hypothetical protein
MKPIIHHGMLLSLIRIPMISTALYICGALMLSNTTVHAAISYLDFSSIAGLQTNGAASQSASALRLTPASPELAGSAWFTTKQSVQAAGKGFSTTFTFRITDPGIAGPADGFAFVIQRDPAATAALGALGGGLGYQGLSYCLAVEFDIWPNGNPPELDLNGNHISVHSAGALPTNGFQADLLGSTGTGLIPVMDDGLSHMVRIDYSPGIMAIFLDDFSQAVLTVPLDLTNINGTSITDSEGKAYVGFTAGTGGAFSNQDILSWQFVPEPTSITLLALSVVVCVAKRWRL